MRHSIICIATLLIALLGCELGGVSTSQPSPETKGRVVFRTEDGRELTASDLADSTGTFEYEVVSNYNIPDEASALHLRARQLGAAEKYEQAIELLAQAHSLAPDWPFPTYDMAYTYLLMEDFAKAREFYEETVRLSPRGFFTAITALDTLEREATGDLPVGTYVAYLSLEWVKDPEQKTKLITHLVERLPQFAPGWKEYAFQCDDPSERLDAIEKGLAATPDAEVKGMLLINKALTLNQQGDSQAAREILGELALDPSTTFSNEHLAKQALSMLIM